MSRKMKLGYFNFFFFDGLEKENVFKAIFFYDLDDILVSCMSEI